MNPEDRVCLGDSIIFPRYSKDNLGVDPYSVFTVYSGISVSGCYDKEVVICRGKGKRLSDGLVVNTWLQFPSLDRINMLVELGECEKVIPDQNLQPIE